MAQPLTKRSAKDGKPYTRRSDVEANIDGAIGNSLAILEQRLQIAQPTSPGYLTSECIVYLFRDAIAKADEQRLSALFTTLVKRCDRTLRHRIRDGDIPGAEAVRQVALDKLTDVLAAATADLDFYEVHFNRAFKNIYLSALRSDKRRRDHFPIAPSEGNELPELTSSIVETPEQEVLASDLMAAIDALPPKERIAVLLVKYQGYDVESTDRLQETAATICGVTGRTIRQRLEQARQKLSHFIEDVNA